MSRQVISANFKFIQVSCLEIFVEGNVSTLSFSPTKMFDVVLLNPTSLSLNIRESQVAFMNTLES